MDDMLRFCVGYATNGKSKCSQCNTKIRHQSLRIGQRVQSLIRDGIETKWFHHDCFIAAPYMFDGPMPKSLADFDNFENISWKDQQNIKHDIAQTDIHHNENIRERALSDDEIMDAGQREREIKEQNKMIFDTRDQLLNLSPSTYQSLLKFVIGGNGKQLPRRSAAKIFVVADAMVFGFLKPCEKCTGRFEYVSGLGYRCTGYFSVWTKCEEVTQDPARIEFVVPEMLRDCSPFLHSYTPKVRKRIVRVITSSTSCLNCYSPTRNRNVLSQLNSLKKTGKQTLWVTKSGAVDPESNLTGIAHVYECNGVSFTVTLVKTCIQTNKNSYCKIQILKHDQLDKYFLVIQRGRIGTKIGNKKCVSLSRDISLEKFKTHYLKYTGNKWIDRGTWVPCKGKMFPVDMDHGENICRKADIENNLKCELKCELKPAVEDLMELIFNKDTMPRSIFQYELDLDKMPLGNLSKKQLLDADMALTTLSNEMETTASDDNHPLKLIDATNRFYNLMPHSNALPFKIQADIKAKRDMISDLLQMQEEYALSKNDINSNEIELKNPVDVNYGRLKTEITVLNRTSKMYKLIERYVKASTYGNHMFEIDDIFVANRAGEEERYKNFKNFPNRKLLWHGSRAVNMPGILSQGLSIAPPEALSTGEMFGKGVYFADRVSKSAQYCCVEKENPFGVLLLCEVALGNMYEQKKENNIKQLPEGKNSTMGLGMRRPDPTQSHKMRDGVEVPCGRSILTNGEGPWALQFNEYVVYNPSQIKVRYLVKLRFYHEM